MTKRPRIADLLPLSDARSSRVPPARAIAVALSVLPAKSTGRLTSETGAAVRTILLALHLAGWKIEPR